MRHSSPLCLFAVAVALALSGCSSSTFRPASSQAVKLSGSVFGGQQPVVGATIQLYAQGRSADGSAALPFFTPPVTTDSNGNFDITGDYTCRSAGYVYLTATGGNAGFGSNNPNLALMVAIDPCVSLSPDTFLAVNELTTVSAVAALYPYMSSATGIGSGDSAAADFSLAFTFANQLVNHSTGMTPGTVVPSGYNIPTAELNTLADILAACVNSTGGTAGSNTACGRLFTLTTVPGSLAPTDTIAAMLNIAREPTQNPTALYNLSMPAAPFQPTLTAPPTDFSVQLQPISGTLAVTASPQGLAFPLTLVNSSSETQTITVTNSSASTIPMLGTHIAGINALDFSYNNTMSTCNQYLAAESSCVFNFVFTPGAVGTRSAALILSAGQGSVSSPIIPLAGAGASSTTGSISLSPSALNFTTANTIQDVTLSNISNTALTIYGITSSDPHFTIETNGCGTTLPAQSVCTISVLSVGFSLNNFYTHYGSFSGILAVSDDASTGAQAVALASLNTSYVTPSYNGSTMLSFGAEPVGMTQTGGLLSSFPGSSYYTSSLTASLSGANASDFAVSPTFCSVPLLSANNSCGLAVSFTPNSTGPRTAKIIVNNNGYVRVTGTGNPPVTSVTTTTISY